MYILHRRHCSRSLPVSRILIYKHVFNYVNSASPPALILSLDLRRELKLVLGNLAPCINFPTLKARAAADAAAIQLAGGWQTAGESARAAKLKAGEKCPSGNCCRDLVPEMNIVRGVSILLCCVTF